MEKTDVNTPAIHYLHPTSSQVIDVSQFFQNAYPENFPYFPRAASDHYLKAWQEAPLTQRLQTKPDLLLCATCQDDIVGLISGTAPEGGVSTIIWLMIAKSHQNQGIGAALLTQAKHYYQSLNCHKIKLTVHCKRAKQFYLRYGFVVEAEHPNHWWHLHFSGLSLAI